jgi:hypothetical protein
MKYLFFFLFLIPLVVGLDIKPGEIMNFDYLNVTNVTGACYQYNGFLFVKENLSVGKHNCYITFSEIGKIPNTSVGGSGHRGYVSYKKTIKVAKVEPVAVNKTEVKPLPVVKRIPEIEKVVLDELNKTEPAAAQYDNTEPIPLKKQSNAFLWIPFVVFIFIILLVVVWYFVSKKFIRE